MEQENQRAQQRIRTINRGFWRIALPAVLASALGGCLFAASGASVVGGALWASQASLSFTKKLPTDHIAETVTGLDCDFNRSLKDGGYLCRPKNAQVVEAPVYCYSTLGTVDCYRQPLSKEASRLVE